MKSQTKSLKPSRFLDPKVDIVFKKIFGNKNILISFLNNILPLDKGKEIKEIEYLPVEQVPEIPDFKKPIVDVKCTDQHGNIFIVEMQIQWNENFPQRIVYGASRAFVSQLKKGNSYDSLCPVYAIGIVGGIIEKGSEEWFHHYKLSNVAYKDKILKWLEIILIELPKFNPKSWVEKKIGMLWMRFLKEIDEGTIDIPKEFFDDENIYHAMELAQESSYSLSELESYHSYLDAIRIHDDGLRFAYRDGKKEGREEGREEERALLIKMLLDSGMDIDEINRRLKV